MKEEKELWKLGKNGTEKWQTGWVALTVYMHCSFECLIILL